MNQKSQERKNHTKQTLNKGRKTNKNIKGKTKIIENIFSLNNAKLKILKKIRKKTQNIKKKHIEDTKSK